MSYVSNLRQLLKAVEAEAAKICKDDTLFARLQVVDDELTLEVRDGTLNVFHTIAFEDHDDFENQEKLLGEITDWIRTSRKNVLDEQSKDASQ